MMILKNMAAGAVAALVLVATPLAAEAPDAGKCLHHAEMAVYLDRAFSEARVAVARLENGNKMELFASRRGSWTLVERLPGGDSCIQAHGSQMQVERKNDTKRPAG